MAATAAAEAGRSQRLGVRLAGQYGLVLRSHNLYFNFHYGKFSSLCIFGEWIQSRASPPGDLTGGGVDALSPCDWILETSPGKGVEINIEQITGANTDCAENYLEVEQMSSCWANIL